MTARHRLWLVALLLGSAALLALGLAIGSTGWSPWLNADPTMSMILWDIRAPRSLGAWTAGALLALAGAVAQGLFRNPLADPYLLGCSAGASLGVAMLLFAMGLSPAATALALRVGMTGAAFVGAVGAVLLTLVLARGVEQTLRLLLAGVVVGVVLGSGSALLTLMNPDIMRAMQAFMLGSTGYVGWSAVQIMAAALLLCMLVALGCSRTLDALSLGEATARSLGVRLPLVRLLLIAVLALATGAAVAQCGLVAFVGLVAPHLVRSCGAITHRTLLLLSPLAGGMLLLAADIGARWVIAPQELPVGIITALLGGSYLLYLMHRRNVRGGVR
ncbi:iron ABC transporter permease [Roseateles asaccharophilus]|uniref:Iron complex transport system permease protein n=1 Tax=Roseateles asaccharophilus TaxID=582607 RepID=A0ABU2A900_9BURK|nr:iron ABC transporter permease [Roseateles asaccharophilus]MDR7333681.1 iron complex transport system permease protein [Roseateles asaccharophilus]